MNTALFNEGSIYQPQQTLPDTNLSIKSYTNHNNNKLIPIVITTTLVG